jgi:Fe-S-cluster containining protein
VELSSKQNLVIPPGAQAISAEMLILLRQLGDLDNVIPSDSAFMDKYLSMLDRYDRYQKSIIGHSAYSLTCKKGCAVCCNHWVEDVNSFEVIIIASYLIGEKPHAVETIQKTLQEDIRQFQKLRALIESRLQEEKENAEIEMVDMTDLILSCFYQAERPCALLSKKGACLVYKVRPLTCRSYVSFASSNLCKPENINDGDQPTYILSMEDEAVNLCDTLHHKYNRFSSTAFRIMLLEALTAH